MIQWQWHSWGGDGGKLSSEGAVALLRHSNANSIYALPDNTNCSCASWLCSSQGHRISVCLSSFICFGKQLQKKMEHFNLALLLLLPVFRAVKNTRETNKAKQKKKPSNVWVLPCNKGTTVFGFLQVKGLIEVLEPLKRESVYLVTLKGNHTQWSVSGSLRINTLKISINILLNKKGWE